MGFLSRIEVVPRVGVTIKAMIVEEHERAQARREDGMRGGRGQHKR